MRKSTSARETAGDRWPHFTWKCPEKMQIPLHCSHLPPLFSYPKISCSPSISHHSPREKELEEAEWDLITSSLFHSRNVHGFNEKNLLLSFQSILQNIEWSIQNLLRW